MLMYSEIADVVIMMVLGAAVGLFIRYIRYLNRPNTLRPMISGFKYIAVGAVLGCVLWILAWHFGWKAPSWDWIITFSIGGFVGIAELASRYKDEPIKAILSVPATIYVLLNALAAAFALVIVRDFNLFTVNGDTITWSQVLAAGFGAMVVLRSAVFMVRVGDKDVGVGPSSFLQSVIDAADRAVDRIRAQERAWAVANAMQGLSSKKAMELLPSFLSALMQNVRPDEQSDFDDRIARLHTAGGSDEVKMLVLGLFAMNYVGEGVLRAAINSLAGEIRAASKETAQAAANAAITAQDAVKAAVEVADAVSRASDAVETASVPEAVAEAANDARVKADKLQGKTSEVADQARMASSMAENTDILVSSLEGGIDKDVGRDDLLEGEHRRRTSEDGGAIARPS